MERHEWKTKDGRSLYIDEMDDRHLVNCVNMVVERMVGYYYDHSDKELAKAQILHHVQTGSFWHLWNQCLKRQLSAGICAESKKHRLFHVTSRSCPCIQKYGMKYS